jgi:hypothetical protein
LTGATGTNNYISKIYKNNGNNTFTEQTGISLTGVYNSSVAWGDYDNDGDLDILLTGCTGTKFISKIYKNNGNNTFTEQTGISLTGVGWSSVAWGDYDNDGDLDILLTGFVSYGNYISKIYKNNGNNTFTEQTGISLTGVSDSSVAWGDYDNDGDLDILLTGNTGATRISKIYKNNGNDTFTEQTGISLTGVSSCSVAWGDYDNDGDHDILMTGYSDLKNVPVSKVYRNNGNNTFTEQAEILITGVYDGSAVWGDYNNDGDLDILLAGNIGISYPIYISKIYKNNGDNSFTEQIGISLSGVYAGSVAWGDYDNDGNLDVLLTGQSGNTYVSKIYKNEGAIKNILPSSPNNLKQTVNNSNVTFTWDKATDKETPQNGLSYNLFIQSKIDGKMVKSPLSDSISGFRKIVNIGNVGQNNSWTINDLPEGIYSWSVQAIDHNFAGSPFAPSVAFEITTTGVIGMMDCKDLVNVYPNPVLQNFSVVSAENGTSVDYQLVDLLGKVIRKGNFIGKTVVETGGMVSGMYLLKVYDGKTTDFVKIIKE